MKGRPPSIMPHLPWPGNWGSKSWRRRCLISPISALMNILYAEAAAAFEDLTLSMLDDTLTWQDEGAWPNTFRKARFLSAVDHVQLDRLRYP